MPCSDLQQFAQTFFKAVDAQHAQVLRPFVTEDIRFQMVNLEPSVGVEALIDAFEATEQVFSSIRHKILGVLIGSWEHGPVVSVEAIAHYTSSGCKVSLAVNSTLRLTKDTLVADYRIFMDPSPAFE